MIAFLTSISEKVGEDAKFMHKGMTSSDVLDTCFNVQLVQASKILNKDIDESLRYLFEEYKRLKLKEKKQKLTIEENETLKKLSSFLGKSNEK